MSLTSAIWVVVLWLVATHLASLGFTLVKMLLDRAFPDTLPQTTARWIADRLVEIGLDKDVRVSEAPWGFNSFVPLSGVVLLDRLTHEKNDPFFWAVGAHELGHAWLHRRVPLLGGLLMLGRSVQAQAGALARAVLFAGILFALDGPARGLLHGTLLVALGCGALVLLDEAIASLFGLVLLLRRGGLSVLQLLGAAVGMAAAFLTYCSGVAADGAVFLLADDLWPVLSGWAGGGLLPALTDPGWLALGVLGLASLMLVWRTVIVSVAVYTIEPALMIQGATGGQLAAAVLVGLTWAQADTPLGQVLLCIAALEALTVLWGFVQSLLVLPVAIFFRGTPLMRMAEEFAQFLGDIAINAFEEQRSTRALLALRQLSAVPYLLWWWIAA